MNKPTINSADPYKTPPNDVVPIDVATLIRTKMLLCASSGGGKSWAVRRVLEQTFGQAQHIVIDRDGEFHTLRERFDYALLGDGGDGAVTVESAHVAARRLVELGVSVIVDLSSLRGEMTDTRTGRKWPRKELWIRNFCEGLIELPRDLWRPIMLVIDEIHRCAPESGMGEAPSTDAVKEIATDGRKRALCLIACTQRVAALHKSVVAELHNKLIGLTTMDLDIQRAARQLGMKPSKAVEALSTLNPGQFHVVGPALCKTVKLVRVGDVVTTHPEPGQADLPPTPPRGEIKKVLGQLKEIAPEGEKELRTVEQLKARVRELEARGSAAPVDEKLAEIARNAERDLETERNWNAALETLLDDVTKAIDGAITENDMVRERQSCTADALLEARNMIPNRLEDEVGRMDRSQRMQRIVEMIRNSGGILPEPQVLPVKQPARGEEPPLVTTVITDVDRALVKNDYSNMSRMERAFLVALAQRGAIVQRGSPMLSGYRPEGPPLAKYKILIYSGYAAGGAASKAFARIVREGWVATGNAGGLVITEAGLKALGSYEPLPTGRALREKIRRELDAMPAKMFDVLIENYPQPMNKGEILKRAGYSAGGAASKAFAYLVARDYAVRSGAGRLVAPKELF